MDRCVIKSLLLPRHTKHGKTYLMLLTLSDDTRKTVQIFDEVNEVQMTIDNLLLKNHGLPHSSTIIELKNHQSENSWGQNPSSNKRDLTLLSVLLNPHHGHSTAATAALAPLFSRGTTLHHWQFTLSCQTHGPEFFWLVVVD